MQFLHPKSFTIRFSHCAFLVLFVLSGTRIQAQTPKEDVSPEDKTSSSVQEFLASFENSALPYQTDDTYVLKDTIPAEMVIEHILDASQTVKPQVFKDLWENDEIKEITTKGLKDRYINVENNAFAVINFGIVSTLDISENYKTVLFKYIPTFMEGMYSYTFLANYSKKGQLIDVVRIGGFAGYVDMQNTWTATVTKNGRIDVSGKSVKKGGMNGMPEDFVETSELSYQLDKNGKILLTRQKFSSFSGSFVRESREEIIHIEEFFDQINILYQSSPDNFSEQLLDIIKVDKKKNLIVTQFPDSLEHVTITYNDARTRFICKNESGDKWEYTRKHF